MKGQEWQIKSRAHKCDACEEKFEDKTSIMSYLEHTIEGYVRQDLCLSCWEQVDDPEVFFSYWRGIYHKPAPPTPEAVQKETAESLLRKLVEDEDPATYNTVYILTIMLERKRILVEKEVQRDEEGTFIRVYEHKKSGEVFLIRDPELKLSELEAVQTEVVARLSGEMPQSEKPSSTEEVPVLT